MASTSILTAKGKHHGTDLFQVRFVSPAVHFNSATTQVTLSCLGKISSSHCQMTLMSLISRIPLWMVFQNTYSRLTTRFGQHSWLRYCISVAPTFTAKLLPWIIQSRFHDGFGRSLCCVARRDLCTHQPQWNVTFGEMQKKKNILASEVRRHLKLKWT